MNKRTLTTGILTTLAIIPTFVGAADEAMTVQSHLHSLWNLLIGALIFFMKSRKKNI